MKVRQLIGAALTFVPGVRRQFKGTGGTNSARYCYAVWMRHMAKAHEAGVWKMPARVAELGPGDSLGIGFCALLSGAEEYWALDVVEHANTATNLDLFEQLVALFQEKASIPDQREFPEVKPPLKDYAFPAHILTERHLRAALDSAHVAQLKGAIQRIGSKGNRIRYVVPWQESTVIEPQSIDYIFSQAVLEHVADLEHTYRAMNLWLKPTGFMSHQIDFRCHGTADEWNGHWAYSDLVWHVLSRARPYLLNRQPHSVHGTMLQKAGFRVVLEHRFETPSRLSQRSLATRFRQISDQDLTTSGAFVVAVPAQSAQGALAP